MSAAQLGLFPLHSVLMPGGLLPLRIFEPRYLGLISRCMRQGEAFGVVLINTGEETDSAVSTESVGTSARIVDFQSLADGLLGILCRGERRFRIVERHQQADGLNCAVVEWLPESGPVPLAPEYLPLVEIVRRSLQALPHSARFLEPHYEDAGWVSHRLAELLPLEGALRQRLLELDDPLRRLELLAAALGKERDGGGAAPPQ